MAELALFQSLIGSLSTEAIETLKALAERFQSLIGSLSTEGHVHEHGLPHFVFQSLIGSLSTDRHASRRGALRGQFQSLIGSLSTRPASPGAASDSIVSIPHR
mgnify:CR=1 FL=1